MRVGVLGRRSLVLGSGFVAVCGPLIPVSLCAQVPSQAPLVPRGRDRYITRVDSQTQTRIIEAVEFALTAAALPGTEHLLVRADRVTLNEDLTFPGRNLTVIARIVKANGSINTSGKTGLPSYTGQTAAEGADGATNTGPGGRGGDVTIIATRLEGRLAITTDGGAGGDAQSGGAGRTGAPGTLSGYNKPPGRAGNGAPGGLVGRPGHGGPAGAITIFTEFAVTQEPVYSAKGGAPGAKGKHGAPGTPGPVAPANRGVLEIPIRCPPV